MQKKAATAVSSVSTVDRINEWVVVAVAAALTDDKRDQTFYDEDPGPSVDSSQSIHFCDSTSE